MIDLSKIADIALVMIDASIGFEMETFEFTSMLKNHGFTAIMGVLTHMDEYRQNKSLHKLKKQIKKRFLKDATDKAKLFYLYGIKSALYMKMQMHNLARYLRVIKPTIPGFRLNHPYVLADRFDVTFLANKSTSDPEEDVMVSFFGYVRGNNFSKNANLHLNGLGDYSIDYITKVEDPCPIETIEIKGKKKRTLKQKEKVLYAPYCNFNNLEYDRNAGYITIPDKFVTFTKGIGENTNVVNDEGVRIVRELQDMGNKHNVIDSQIKNNKSFEIFEGVDYDEQSEEELGNNNHKKTYTENITSNYDKKRRLDEKIDNIVNNFELKSEPAYYKESATKDITREIYDFSTEDEDSIIPDCSKYHGKTEFDLNFLIVNARPRFITGASLVEEEGNEEESEDEENQGKKRKGRNNKEEEQKEEIDNNEENNAAAASAEAVNAANSVAVKEFLSEEFGLFEKGTYVRIDIKKIKKKYIDHFKVDFPIILATTSIQETSFGFLKIRFTKHIWYPKILKNNDPIVFSIGWRKFQATPIYCVEDKNHRLRMIKYTPKYTQCFAVCWGPLLPINVAVVAFQQYNQDVQHFRICGTGDLIEVNQSFEIVKKLKLIGEPMETFKKTAFIKGMFNSNLEVARYMGASIRTVSGIRGQIKKQLNTQPEGSFRATFEDKILKSDVVFLKTWNPIIPNKFYNPIVSYGKMKFMRTTAQLRKDYDIALPTKDDSEYKPITREQRIFPSLVIPKSLEENLPFKAKNKVKSVVKNKSINFEEDDTFLLKKLNLPHNKPLKSYLTDKEKSIYSMLQRLNTIKNIKVKYNY